MTPTGRSRAAALLVACGLILHSSSCNDQGAAEEQHTLTPRREIDDRIYACLQNCANCVQFWASGLYNGRRCAKRCLRQQGREVVDPDCNDPKMFNYSPRIIDLLLEMQQNERRGDSTVATEVTASGPASMESRSASVVRLGGRHRKKAPLSVVEGIDEDPPSSGRDEASFRVEVEARQTRPRSSGHGRPTRRLPAMDDEVVTGLDRRSVSVGGGHPHAKRLTGNDKRRRPQRRKLTT